MKKVGIATITIMEKNENAYNYGNKLQNYALQNFLKKNGYYPETIKYKTSPPDFIEKNNTIKKNKRNDSFIQIVDDCIRILKRKIYKNYINSKKNERMEKFDQFVRKNINYNNNLYDTNSDFENLKNEYDCFITGSDQVWNPYYEGSNEFYYLTFANKNQRIAYAPSIAVPEIPNEIEQNYEKWVKGMKFLSIREDAGRDLLKRKFDVDAKLVCDPVFLLSKDEWKDVIKCPDIKEKYFLVYILGKKDTKTKKNIRKLEKKLKLKAIDVYTRDDKNSFFAGPEEFLGLLKNSEFVVTDSFHGVAFSTIFNKNFIIVDRKSKELDEKKKMNSRIDSLLRLLDIQNRNIEYIVNNLDNIPINYSKETNKLMDLITESKKYLLSALQTIEEGK